LNHFSPEIETFLVEEALSEYHDEADMEGLDHGAPGTGTGTAQPPAENARQSVLSWLRSKQRQQGGKRNGVEGVADTASPAVSAAGSPRACATGTGRACVNQELHTAHGIDLSASITNTRPMTASLAHRALLLALARRMPEGKNARVSQLRAAEHVVRKAATAFPEVLLHSPWSDDLAMVFDAVKAHGGTALQYGSEKLRSDARAIIYLVSVRTNRSDPSLRELDSLATLASYHFCLFPRLPIAIAAGAFSLLTERAPSPYRAGAFSLQSGHLLPTERAPSPYRAGAFSLFTAKGRSNSRC
jgi:hypothetical protein